MYGYISLYFEPTQQEKQLYQYYYCGLCHSLKKYFSEPYRLTIIKEVVLFEIMQQQVQARKYFKCPYVLFKEKNKPENIQDFKHYAYINSLIVYGKLKDNVNEGKRIPRILISKLRKKLSLYFSDAFISRYEELIYSQTEAEKEKSDFDDFARPSSEIMYFIAQKEFSGMEFDVELFSKACGTLVYLIDAVYDFKTDVKKSAFNAIAKSFGITDITRIAAKDFERLVFTYDICVKSIYESLNTTEFKNNQLVHKLLSYSFTYHRNKIIEIFKGEKNENNRRACKKR